MENNLSFEMMNNINYQANNMSRNFARILANPEAQYFLFSKGNNFLNDCLEIIIRTGNLV